MISPTLLYQSKKKLSWTEILKSWKCIYCSKSFNIKKSEVIQEPWHIYAKTKHFTATVEQHADVLNVDRDLYVKRDKVPGSQRSN